MVRIPHLSHIHYDLEGFICNNNGDGEAQQGDVAVHHGGEQVVQDHLGMSYSLTA